MSEFVLLIVGDEEAYAALDEETGKRMYAQHTEFMDALKAAGVSSPYSAEMAPTPVQVVRPREGGTVVTDGPYAETKEQLGGFYVVDVPTIDDAVGWARRIPLLSSDVVEVRAVR
jgi:hypothetical protein